LILHIVFLDGNNKYHYVMQHNGMASVKKITFHKSWSRELIDDVTFADLSCLSARHEGVWGNGGITTLITKLGPRWGEHSSSPYSCYTVREISYIE